VHVGVCAVRAGWEVWQPAGRRGTGCGGVPENHTGVLLSADCRMKYKPSVWKIGVSLLKTSKCQRLIWERENCLLEKVTRNVSFLEVAMVGTQGNGS